VRPRDLVLCTIVATVVALGLDAVPVIARALTVSLLVPFPMMSVMQARLLAQIDVTQLPRIRLYVMSSATLWVLAFLAVWAAQASRFPAATIGFDRIGTRPFIAWTVFGLGAAALLMAITKLMRLPESAALEHLLPRSIKERIVFVGAAITAGITEEIVFRGFLISALALVLPNVWLAALVSSIVFGMLHAYQGWIGMGRTAVLGFALAVPFLLTSSIMPSIVAHIVIDLIGGLWFARALRAAA
jgi:uncharacterized protein